MSAKFFLLCKITDSQVLGIRTRTIGGWHYSITTFPNIYCEWIMPLCFFPARWQGWYVGRLKGWAREGWVLTGGKACGIKRYTWQNMDFKDIFPDFMWLIFKGKKAINRIDPIPCCPPPPMIQENRLNKSWYFSTMEYYSANKRNALLVHGWISKISEWKRIDTRTVFCMIPFIRSPRPQKMLYTRENRKSHLWELGFNWNEA